MWISKAFLIGLFCTSVLAGPTLNKRGGKELSEEEHYNGDQYEHNAQYDHEAFLGKEQAQSFDQLPHEEARRRLGIIVDKIDKNRDGKVSQEEMEEWVRHVARRYVYDDVDSVWDYHDMNKDGFIDMEEYKNVSFGVIEDLDMIYDTHRQQSYRQRMERDNRRFKVADRNGDKKLDREEFASFLHPEETPYMREVVVEETMTDMDTNKDGFVTLEEYLNDLWPTSERTGGEPEWIKSEKEQFLKFRDRDGNGKLDIEEIGDWVMPPDYDHAHAEANHLMHHADQNKDKFLSREEVLADMDLFVGSQATDFGDYMMRHDEF